MTEKIPLSRVVSGVLSLITLTAWALLLTLFYFDLRLRNLTNPFLHPWMLLAGGILLLIVIMRFVEIAQRGAEALNCGEECRDSPDLNVSKVVTFIVLIIPVIMAFSVDPNTFSGQFVRNRGVEMSAPSMQTMNIPPMTREEIESVLQEGIVYDTDIVEILMLADDPVARSVLERKMISFTAQLVYPERIDQPSESKTFYGVRLYMLCCAADARPVGVLIRSDDNVEIKEMSWAKITGALGYVNYNGRLVPEVQMTSFEDASAPEEPYLF